MVGIFKAYDIRGLVRENGLTKARAELIGRALAIEVFQRRSPIVVSRDMRTHSPALSEALIRGLTLEGCDVLDIGLASTPMNYWANAHFNAQGSVSVTASHNGPGYNGFKVSGPGVLPIGYQEGLQAVEAWVQRAESSGKISVSSQRQGSVTTPSEDALNAYLDYMGTFMPASQKPLKIAVDAANGMSGHFLPGFFARYPWLTPVPLYWDLDGNFPNHEADPLKPENLEALQASVRENQCDMGVAFDGDADRCMFIDETGEPIGSDLITALIGEKVLGQKPGSPILYDIRSSAVVPEWIAAHGGKPVRGRVGHSFMKRLLREENAPFGGELSGHYYFADCFHSDSGLMAMIQVIDICWRESGKFSERIRPLRKYQATGEINYRVADAPAVLRTLERHYAERGAEIDHLDGLTVRMPGWWFNLRSSNTEPLLRLNLEAATREARAECLKEVQSLIEHPLSNPGGSEQQGQHASSVAVAGEA